MEIVAQGYCNDCETTVAVEFDDEGGAPYCVSCGCYEVDEVETDEVDNFDDEFELIDEEDDEDEDDGTVIDDEY